MTKLIKFVIVVVMIIYVVSPVDLCPGPIDDVIVVLIGIAANRGLAKARE